MKIFLGYASEQLEAARDVYSALKTTGHEIWFDKEALVGGDDWDSERRKAQESADFVVHLVSNEVFERAGVVNREIRQTLRLIDDQPFGAAYVVFVRVSDIRLPADLIRFQYIDYFGDDWVEGLLRAVEKKNLQLTGKSDKPSGLEAKKAEVVSRQVNSIESVSASASSEYFSATSEYLQYPEKDAYWRSVNARLASDCLDLFVKRTGEFNRMDSETKSWISENGGRPHEWHYVMQQYFHSEDFLSVRCATYVDFGGAHPNHGVHALNFLGRDFGICSAKELLGHSDDSADRLLQYCKKVLVASLEEHDVDDFLEEQFSQPDHRWPLVSQYNFDERGLILNFSPYDVLPYVFGSHEVFVPWTFALPLFGEEFRDLEDRINASS